MRDVYANPENDPSISGEYGHSFQRTRNLIDHIRSSKTNMLITGLILVGTITTGVIGYNMYVTHPKELTFSEYQLVGKHRNNVRIVEEKKNAGSLEELVPGDL